MTGFDRTAEEGPSADASSPPRMVSFLPCLGRLALLQNHHIDQLDLREAAGLLDQSQLTLRKVRKGIAAGWERQAGVG